MHNVCCPHPDEHPLPDEKGWTADTLDRVQLHTKRCQAIERWGG